MPTLHRTKDGHREVLTLRASDYEVEVGVDVRGLEVSATTVERALHAAVARLVQDQDAGKAA